MVVTLFNVENREIRRNRHTRQLEGTKHSRHRSEHAVAQKDENDSEKETLIMDVQKKMMLTRNKRSDKNGCAEEADDDDDNKEERIDKTCSEKAEVNDEGIRDNEQCSEEADDNH
jgi:hypothetical protein